MSSSSYDPAFSRAGTSLAPLDAADSSTPAAASKVARSFIQGIVDPNDPFALTPLRAHYLKKTLIKIQLEKEISLLNTKDALSTFGPPFRPSPIARSTDLPLLRFLFQHFVLTFPFLRSAPPNFFADKVQVFVDRFLEKNISGTDDRQEATKRKQLASKFEKYFVLLMGSAIKVKTSGEDVVKITEQDRQKISLLEARRRAALGRAAQLDESPSPSSSHSNIRSVAASSFDINVISVRNVIIKGRIRSRAHEEFIIRTRTGFSQPDIYVSRRYGDFARLADTLKIEFPDEDIRPPPSKDRSHIDVASPFIHRQPLDQQDAPSTPPISAFPSTSDFARSRTNSAFSQDGYTTTFTGSLAREKNRLTLRAYLRSLLAVPVVADSAIFMDFLTDDPTTLTFAEEEDAATREGLDHIREEEHRRFAQEAARRAQELQQHLESFKSDLIQKDGLTRIFATIKSTPNIQDLPEKYRALLKWGRISLASTLFHIFMGSDNSSDIFFQLKRMHGLMPYFMLRGILKISNPVSMIRGVIDLFLAQPFGQKSLLQRMFSSSLQDEVKEIQDVCEAITVKVDDPILCEKVRNFVYASPEVQQVYRQEAENERLDLLTTILRSPEYPALDRAQIHRVVMASREYEIYKQYRRGLKNPQLEDEGPQNEEAWLYEDLHVLIKMLTRQRDKEQMISLIFEGVTAELLKDIVTIFYSPLAQVYKLANISDSLSDLQTFINDLIKTVEANQEPSYTDPGRTVQVFVDLVERHEAKFYSFVHQVHSKGSGLFDGLMHWIELFINFVRGNDRQTIEDPNLPKPEGNTSKAEDDTAGGIGEIDLEICMPAGGEQRRRALEEIDSLVLYAYKLKFLREVKLRRKLADREVAGAAKKLMGSDQRKRNDAMNDDQAIVSAMIENLGVGDIFAGEVVEAEGEEEEEEEEEEEDEDGDDDTSSHEDFFDASDSESLEAGTKKDAMLINVENQEELNRNLNIRRWRPEISRQSTLKPGELGTITSTSNKELPALPTEAKAKSSTKSRKLQPPKPPELQIIPEMLPLLVELVRPLLRPARTTSISSSSDSSRSSFLFSQQRNTDNNSYLDTNQQRYTRSDSHSSNNQESLPGEYKW